MSWTVADHAKYEAMKLAGKARTSARKLLNTTNRCHLCDGGGERFETDGSWFNVRFWETCYGCNGTGKAEKGEIPQ